MRTKLILALLFVFLCCGGAQAEKLKFVADNNFAPYSMSQDGKAAGIDVELFQEAARRADIAYELELMPWEQVVQRVRTGACDGAFSFFRTPEREAYAVFAEEAVVHFSDYVLFTRNGHSFEFRTWDDLDGKRIGVNKGFRFSEEFDDNVAKGDIVRVEFDSEAKSIAALLKGQVDAFIGQLDTTYYQLDRMGMASTVIYLPTLVKKDRPAYMVISKNADLQNKEQIARRLGIALRSMYRDGTYSKIARRYLLRF
ncbi:substrate-binding periplasmic protein [Salidesulfovibrio onnuriiensis]|uniref:substrate-binding periplasmic protein n=1 Tax=Salidesulfovibrio onnuriiensis TaxID=2583823 RepID=UPI0011CAD637|nr:transporter substrate-binding domain-containing protein [Salidesulfovibrio onnuriiensis]